MSPTTCAIASVREDIFVAGVMEIAGKFWIHLFFFPVGKRRGVYREAKPLKRERRGNIKTKQVMTKMREIWPQRVSVYCVGMCHGQDSAREPCMYIGFPKGAIIQDLCHHTAITHHQN